MGLEQILAFMLLGLGYGALIAGLATGMVVTFRSSGVINIAAGATAAYSAYTYSELRTTGVLALPIPIPLTADRQPLDTLPALLVGLVLAAVLGLAQYLLVYRPLASAGPLAKIVASSGVLLTVQAVIVLRWGADPVAAPAVLPQESVALLGVTIPADRLLLAGLVIAVTALLWALYRHTRFGIATRAAADNMKGSVLLGLSTTRLEAANWVIAGVLGGLFGMLAAPTTQLQPVAFTLLVVPVLTAALLGGFSSLGVTVATAFGLGMVNSLIALFQGQPWFPQAEGGPLPGLTELVPFLVLAVVLYLRGRTLPDRLTALAPSMPRAPRPRHAGPAAVIGTVVVVAALAGLPFDWRQALINSMLGALLCLSVVVTTGFVGQISFAQMAVAGAAGYITAAAGTDAGLPFPLPPIAGIAAAVITSLVFSVPARRVRGLQLAVLTLAGGVAAQRFWFGNPQWGSGLRPANVEPIAVFGMEISPSRSFWGMEPPTSGFGLVVFAVLLLCALLVVWIRRSALGARMLAVRSSEAAAAAAGVNVGGVKTAAFAIGGLLAGAAGVLYGYNFAGVSADRFGPLTSIAFFGVAVLGGVGTVSGALVGGLLVAQGLLFHAVTTWFGIAPDYQPLFAGLAVILTVIGSPNGVAVSLADAARTLRGATRRRRTPRRAAAMGES
ncbi:ABC transporter permease [Spongiactinospora sp. TRM90649]|uniref:ABC transporter permease n=1 Tax=Spongiactinospora sp. TRM90649 TaxID=3031114 RepID=UPI0023F7BD7F|nr:ABC transporter permease [Spongiactinospora sp. TRM90649]MDF5753078.1 ABC transporter permease [Spongiactinospora sp. TRM90649]